MALTTANRLREALGSRLRLAEPLARYTSARAGGPAEFLVVAESGEELAETARLAYRLRIEFRVLGGGSNVLVADNGVKGLVILNRAKNVTFREGEKAAQVNVQAESGASLGALARQCVQAGLAGLEWAATVPGTVGGAVYGNAGAHGGEMGGSLRVVKILQQDGSVQTVGVKEMQFSYRMSGLKQGLGIRGEGLAASQAETNPIGSVDRNYLGEPAAVVLGAEFEMQRDDPAALQARVDEFTAHRKRTQPPGASIGSMFKNPPGDYAGRLIEAAGLKGTRVGGAAISNVHANFFVNEGQASATDVKQLLDQARETVKQQFGVELEPEIELVGDW